MPVDKKIHKVKNTKKVKNASEVVDNNDIGGIKEDNTGTAAKRDKKDDGAELLYFEDGTCIDFTENTLPEAFGMTPIDFMDSIAGQVDTFNELFDNENKNLKDIMGIIECFGSMDIKSKFTIMTELINEYTIAKNISNSLSLIYWNTVGESVNTIYAERLNALEAELNGLRNVAVNNQRKVNEMSNIMDRVEDGMDDDDYDDDEEEIDPNSIEALLKKKEQIDKNKRED